MALILTTDSSSDFTVNMDPDINTYIITGTTGNTYTYNLPAGVPDGAVYTLIRKDTTTASVNLVGSLYLNGTVLSSFPLVQSSSTNVIFLGTYWYITFSGLNFTPNIPLRVLFSAFFNGSSPVTSIGVPSSAGNLFLSFPYLGRNNCDMKVISICLSSPLSSVPTLYVRANGALFIVYTMPTGVLNFSYTLVYSDIAALPGGPSTITFHYGGFGNMNISSLTVYG